MHHKMNTLRSMSHEIYAMKINKKSLFCFDDKRYVLSNGIDSFAYGHFLTRDKQILYVYENRLL